ncbi:predicted protein [Plenodomus lingam JN3]|uniref:Predicted protein n=1 Tax=Leptosphaeria maculans (strain JN3 / isolate v23.1.3 / race Av1-4-5-6-7-8) TaxID=985895 RepID=E5A151_LEPMJ|nr:predicted protein [Plenodomus lingam JN3]CBX97507.1 predicted protein [Plenodomus lingam JN3]
MVNRLDLAIPAAQKAEIRIEACIVVKAVRVGGYYYY